MQRTSVRDLLKNMKIKEIANPLAYMFLLSMLYNIVYLGSVYISNIVIYYLIQIVLGLISSVGFYWICALCWNRKVTKEAVIRVLILETIYLGIVTGILPAIGNIVTNENMVLQVFAALIGICMIPIQVIYFVALTEEVYAPKELINFVLNILKKHSKPIINWFCIGLIVVFFIDTILGGIFSLSSGINATLIASSILLYGNPMMNWMMTLFMSLVFGISFVSTFPYIVVFFIIGLWYGVAELNYVLFVQRKCLDNGTSKNTANKKKNRTSK